MTWPDTLFWAVLGALVTVNLLWERRYPAARATERRFEPVKVFGTFCVIVTLWSLWNAPSVPEWVDLVTWWRVG
jgi:hypothetical protein